MNCKGNELARIVVPEDVLGCEHHGKIIWITNKVEGISAWYFEGAELTYEDAPAELKGYKLTWLYDEYLRPIGNPPDDAVDETLLWKKVPEYNKPKEPVTTED